MSSLVIAAPKSRSILGDPKVFCLHFRSPNTSGISNISQSAISSIFPFYNFTKSSEWQMPWGKNQSCVFSTSSLSISAVFILFIKRFFWFQIIQLYGLWLLLSIIIPIGGLHSRSFTFVSICELSTARTCGSEIENINQVLSRGVPLLFHLLLATYWLPSLLFPSFLVTYHTHPARKIYFCSNYDFYIPCLPHCPILCKT